MGGGGGGATLLAGLLLVGCTTKIGSINPNHPSDPKMQKVYGVACDSFTWPYGKNDEALKSRAMESVNAQAQAIVSAADAKEAELANVNITKNIWPWFWGLMGQKCVQIDGYAIPKGLSAAAEARKKAAEEAAEEVRQANTHSCEGWKYLAMGSSTTKEDAQKALETFTRDSKSTDPHTQACALEGLGFLYQYGLGVKQDKAKAIQFYEQEGKLGYGIGYGNIAGIFQDSDEKKMSYYLDLCNQAPHKPGGNGRDGGCALAAGLGGD